MGAGAGGGKHGVRVTTRVRQRRTEARPEAAG